MAKRIFVFITIFSIGLFFIDTNVIFAEDINLSSDIQAARAQYGDWVSHEQAAKILDTIAWNHQSEGWGLLRKSGGNNCPLESDPIACDILFNKVSGNIYDVFSSGPGICNGISAAGKAGLSWGLDGPGDASLWVAPIDPASLPDGLGTDVIIDPPPAECVGDGTPPTQPGTVLVVVPPDAFDLGSANIVNSPGDVASWPATATITNVDLNGTQAGPGTIQVDFDKRTGDSKWTETYTPEFNGSLQYTLWVFLNINGQWTGSGVVQFWTGRELTAASSIDQMPCTLFYDSRWGALSGHSVQAGDKIGFMVTQGNARGRTTSDGDLRERSNVVVVPAPVPSTCVPSDSGGTPPNTSGSGTGGTSSFGPALKLGVPNKGLPTDLGQLISAIFVWSLSLIGLVIFVRFFYAGFLWFTAAGNTTNVTKAQGIMKNAVYGVLVLFSAWLILNTINPDLVGGVVKLPGIPATNPTAGTSGTRGTTTHLCGPDYVCTNDPNKGCYYESDCGGTDPVTCVNGVWSNGDAGPCQDGSSSGNTPATCTGKNDAGDGTCSDNPNKTCTTDIECVGDNSTSGSGLPSTCINQNDAGDGVCSNNESQPCTTDSECGN